jgi:OmpA-OmpF porin, OOP family
VFFDFDKANLSPDARQVVDAAVNAVCSDIARRIALIGKADLTGTDRYNMSLSRRRADNVRDALLEDGVTPDRIDDHWMGDREPPVPTANGVRESRNRVVEVSLR